MKNIPTATERENDHSNAINAAGWKKIGRQAVKADEAIRLLQLQLLADLNFQSANFLPGTSTPNSKKPALFISIFCMFERGF